MLRNQSLIVDLFHGQLRSQVRCKECGKVSMRFDPYSYLSLPLPMDSCIHLEILGKWSPVFDPYLPTSPCLSSWTVAYT